MNEYVSGKVSLPGTLLQVYGGLVLLANLWTLVVFFIQVGLGMVQALIAGDMETFMVILTSSVVAAVSGLAFPIVALLVGIVVILAGSRLKSTSGAGLVYAGALFSMLPCCSGSASLWVVNIPCCCVGAAVGIWVIVTMQDEQVKAAFAESV